MCAVVSSLQHFDVHWPTEGVRIIVNEAPWPPPDDKGFMIFMLSARLPPPKAFPNLRNAHLGAATVDWCPADQLRSEPYLAVKIPSQQGTRFKYGFVWK